MEHVSAYGYRSSLHNFCTSDVDDPSEITHFPCSPRPIDRLPTELISDIFLALLETIQSLRRHRYDRRYPGDSISRVHLLANSHPQPPSSVDLFRLCRNKARN